MDVHFLQAVFAGGIRHPNFFNGRILTATDLRDEQAAQLKLARYLGQAAGEGVVYGLDVTTEDGATLAVTGGLALNRRGDGLCLPTDRTTIALVITEPVAEPVSPFQPCDLAGAIKLTGVVNTGFHILAITSAARFDRQPAPHSGLNGPSADSNDDTSCISGCDEIGVQFKVIPLDAEDMSDGPSGTEQTGRSRLAHACFGTPGRVAQAANPFGPSPVKGLLDRLREDKRLTDCDVPLAAFHFQNNRVLFVDVWAVRRPCLAGLRPGVFPTRPATLPEILTCFVSPRPAIEAAAFLLQFQNHLEDLRTDPAIDPPKVKASDHFHYLPAAGYLPVQAAETGRHFVAQTFFGSTFAEKSLDPAYLHAIFHESFYQQPIQPGVDGVDLYTVTEGDRYRIFVRQPQLFVITQLDDTGKEEGKPPGALGSGELMVAVLSDSGAPVPSTLVDSVTATDQATEASYTARRITFSEYPGSNYQSQEFAHYLQQLGIEVKNKYAKSKSRRRTDGAGHSPDLTGQTVYLFKELPAGTYTIQAYPAEPDYYSASPQVKVQPHTRNRAVVVIAGKARVDLNDPLVGGKTTTPEGVVIDGYWFNPKWPEWIPDWEEKIPNLDPGFVDPAPDDWHKVDDRAVTLGIEELLGYNPVADRTVVTADPTIYVSTGIDPARPSATVNAFVQTRDGSRFPLVARAADNALPKAAPADRTGIRDYDRTTMNRLETAGLARLDAVASAPVPLLAAVLGQSPAYAESLVQELQSALQADFREGYMGYTGIGKAESDALKGAFKDKVEFANASPEAVARELGQSNTGFAGRLLSDVRNSLPAEAFTLAGTSMPAEKQAALEGVGVTTNKEFRDMAATEEGRTRLKETLGGINDETLNRYLQEATLAYATGEFFAEPEKSIATLPGMTPEVAAKLASEGYGSAKSLANSDAAALAGQIGISEAEMSVFVAEATRFASQAHLTLLEAATRDPATREAITKAGYTSAGAIVRADVTDLQKIEGIDASTAATMKNVMDRFIGSSGVLGSLR